MDITGRVIGLDLSLTSTGVSDTAETHVIKPGKLRGEARLDEILGCVRYFIHLDATLVVIEGPAYGAGAQSGHDELAGLRWMVRHALWRRDIPFAMVPPSTLKMFTTGGGRATKENMADAILYRHGADFSGTKVTYGRYDKVDAYALAAMGRYYLGLDVPHSGSSGWFKPTLSSLDAVEWPTVRRTGELA